LITDQLGVVELNPDAVGAELVDAFKLPPLQLSHLDIRTLEVEQIGVVALRQWLITVQVQDHWKLIRATKQANEGAGVAKYSAIMLVEIVIGEDELLIVVDLTKLGEYVVMQSLPERRPPLLCRLILSATEPVKQAELEELGLCGNDFREHRQVVALASLVVN